MGSDDQIAEGNARDHLEDVDDGCGCAEIWEHLSERRRNEHSNGKCADDDSTGDD